MCKKRQGRGYVSRKKIGNDARIMKFKETIIVCNPCSYVGSIPVVALVLFLDTLVATMGRTFLSATLKHFLPAKEGHGHFRVCRHCWEGKEDQLPDTIDDEPQRSYQASFNTKMGHLIPWASISEPTEFLLAIGVKCASTQRRGKAGAEKLSN